MAQDVLITPASGLIEFYETAGNLEASIQLDNSNNLVITGNVTLGDAGADIIIGDGVSAANVIFEQGGAIYGLATKTLTLGTAGSFLSLAANITSGANITGNVTGNFFLGNGSQLTGINSFGTIAVSGQSSVTADSIADTLTLAAGSGISIVTNADTDTITIATIGSGDSIFGTGGDMGTVEQAVTAEEDLGLITDAITESYDMGTIVLGGLVYPSQLVLPSFTVAELASLTANPVGQMVICTNEAGGTVPAFSDGTDWRRVTDRAVIT